MDNPKVEWFTAINPNGRVPAIVDPNTGLTLWESGAIVEYLVETYDKEGKLTVPDTAGKWHLKQYLHFQMSGQVSFKTFIEDLKNNRSLTPLYPRARTTARRCGSISARRISLLQNNGILSRLLVSSRCWTTS